MRPRVAEVAREPVLGFLPERNDAVLAAFAAADVDELLLEVHVVEVEPDGLGASQTGRVDELHERAVSQRERVVALEGREQLLDLGGAGRVRKSPRPARRDRRVRYASRAESETQERPNSGETPRHARRCEAGARSSEPGCVIGKLAHSELVDAQTSHLEPAREVLEVDAVGPPCRVGEGRAAQKAVDLALEGHTSRFAPAVTAPRAAMTT